MKRKGLVRLLGIVLALMLPLSAMAQGSALDMLTQASAQGKEIVTTITFEPGQTLAANPVVADLSKATAIRVSKMGGGFGGFSLLLNGVDVMSAKLHVQEDGIYILSETLGEKPLYFSWEDVQKGMAEAMRSSGADQASIDSFNQSFMNGFRQGFAMGMAGASEGMKSFENLTDEQIKQKITESLGGDDSLVKWIETIEAKKVVTTGEFTLEGSDVADTKTELVVTKEDMAALYDVAYIQKQIATQIKAEDTSLTDEQVQAKLASMVADIKAEIDRSGAEMPMVFYTKGTSDLVAVDVKFSGTFTPSKNGAELENATTSVAATTEGETATPSPEPAKPAKIDVAMLITSKTLDNGKMYNFSMSALQDDVKKLSMTGTLTKAAQTVVGTLTAVDGEDKPLMIADLTADYTDAKHLVANLAMTGFDNGASNAVVMDLDQTVGDTTIDTLLSVSAGTSVDAIKADAAAAKQGTLKVITVVQDDSGAYADLKDVKPEAAVQPMKMNAEELQTFFAALQSTGMQTLYKVLGNLPPSVSELLGGAMGN
ncbi:MAG: hypothetical protein VB087_07110 [Candidatus Limiplasma sp.]|nr:hypothetical protein [Candidatus Limiplasma sp.]